MFVLFCQKRGPNNGGVNEYIAPVLLEIDAKQELINKQRPLEQMPTKNIKDYYKIGLTMLTIPWNEIGLHNFFAYLLASAFHVAAYACR